MDEATLAKAIELKKKADLKQKKADLKTWNMYREAAGSEKAWMHERLSWLFTPQGILFAAYSLTLKAEGPQSLTMAAHMREVIPVVGIGISVVVFFMVFAASVMHKHWTKPLRELAQRHAGAITFGSPPHWPATLARWLPLALPFGFAAAWLYLLMI
ncbi:MAG TPA: hypothetical protein VK610_08155 [Rhodothermales bacterium]|nr:hypothetical protein [Rhodothermales bacterium]